MIPESKWYKPTDSCPEPELWSSVDGVGVATEIEVIDFIWSLVRLLKPKIVIETGCYRGETSIVIGQALSRNGRGWLQTCDVDSEKVESLKARALSAGLPIIVTEESGWQLVSQTPHVDLAFIDSGGPSDRGREIQALRMSPGGLIVLHDANSGAPEVEKITGLKPSIFVNTPRGLAIYVKS